MTIGMVIYGAKLPSNKKAGSAFVCLCSLCIIGTNVAENSIIIALCFAPSILYIFQVFVALGGLN